jgi:hypothetical protein
MRDLRKSLALPYLCMVNKNLPQYGNKPNFGGNNPLFPRNSTAFGEINESTGYSNGMFEY